DIIIKTIADVVDENNLLSLVKKIAKEFSSDISLKKLNNVRNSDIVVRNPLLGKIYDAIISVISLKP
ncbi:MAG: hypothetical protein N3A54_07490, partial [Patescibacteria group bacterium]|nr:hypothetical protein [Patescibacteria group bacterium]